MAISNTSSNVAYIVAPSSKNGPIKCCYCKKPRHYISYLAHKRSSRIDQSKSQQLHNNSCSAASVTNDDSINTIPSNSTSQSFSMQDP